MKKIIIFLVLLVVPSFSYAIVTDYSYLKIPELENITAEHILLYNLDDDKIVYGKNFEEETYVASLTKLMTVFVAVERINDYDELVIMDNLAFQDLDGYSTAGFNPGDLVTMDDLLYATMLKSGAEAAQMLSIIISGSVDNFVLLMNEYAEYLHMDNTYFSNPIGKDKDNHSSLSDLQKLLTYALKNDKYYEIFTAKKYTTSNDLKFKSTLQSVATRNNLDISNILGSKTGYTNNAGLCLASIAKYNNDNYLLIVTNSYYGGVYLNHVSESVNIYDYFSKNYKNQNIININDVLYTIDVEDSVFTKYNIRSNLEYSLYIDNKYKDNLKYNYVGVEKINPNYKKGDYLGVVEISYNNELLYTYEVYLDYDIITKENFYYLLLTFIIIIFILFIIYFKKQKKRKKRKH